MILEAGLLLVLASALPQEAEPPARWFKGNTHAHTRWDDGDALPEVAVEWYRSRGYNFVVLSDHNERNCLSGAERWVTAAESGGQVRLKTFSELEKAFAEPGRFALLPGQEIGDSFQGKLIHHTVVNSERILLPPGGGSVREVMARALEGVEAEAARARRPVLAHLNHPNLGWAAGAGEITDTAERFLEIYNGHPAARNGGDGEHPSAEAMWDLALSARLRAGRGPLLYGIASDDAHHYSAKGGARPGRAWIMVRARALSGDAIVRSMQAGEFYSSTGVILEDICAGECGLRVRVATKPGEAYTIRFIGSRRDEPEVGTVLQEAKGVEGYYEYSGDELYVRAVVVSDRPPQGSGREGEVQTAWIQPVAFHTEGNR